MLTMASTRNNSVAMALYRGLGQHGSTSFRTIFDSTVPELISAEGEPLDTGIERADGPGVRCMDEQSGQLSGAAQEGRVG